ncbi:MAG: hypothetical protein MUE46_11790 [Xanthomonadales bacterium]|jgi:hypothetical protein|nr:hypothetical protein [Xanthomonadales bacterium]
MAKRIIDGEYQDLPGNYTLAQVVPSDTKSVVTFGGQVIPREQFHQTRLDDIPRGFDTNAANIIQAGISVAPGDPAALLRAETHLIQQWLNTFTPSPAGARHARWLPEAQLLVISHFPLPDAYQPDHINIVVHIANYPAVPPIGIYLDAASINQRNIDRLRARFNVLGRGHHDAAQPFPGYQWICLITEGWRVNHANLQKGQTLQKFLATFFAKAD